jgi:hypothetical protein
LHLLGSNEEMVQFTATLSLLMLFPMRAFYPKLGPELFVEKTLSIALKYAISLPEQNAENKYERPSKHPQSYEHRRIQEC